MYANELMTERQYRAALRLAQAHGHEWADREDRPWEALGFPLHPGIIGLIVQTEHMQLRFEVPAGIEQPTLDESGASTHTTGTGRLSWRVERDGATVLRVYRPQGLVLRCHVHWDQSADLYRENRDIPIHERHRQAIFDALAALLGAAAAEAALPADHPALAGMLPDPVEV